MSEVRVRVVLRGTQVEYAGRLGFYERAVEPLLDALRAVAGGDVEAALPGEARAVARAPEAWKPQQPQQFVQFTEQVGPRASGVDQRIMAFAFYLWNYEKQEAWGADDVRAFFRTLRDEPPEDLDERLDQLCVAKRFVEEAAEGAGWRLTAKGVNYVKNRLLGPA